MEFSVTYDPIKSLYDIRLNIEIDGLEIDIKHVFTEEILHYDGDDFLEYEAESMMMDAMRLASESYMPGAIKQIKQEIEGTKTGKSKSAKKPDDISLKYGKTLVTIDEEEEDELLWSTDDGASITSTLNKYIDLNQRVDIPKQALIDMGVEDIDHGAYKNGRLGDVIVSLNDTAKWSYEQIADWLETLDVNITIDLTKPENDI